MNKKTPFWKEFLNNFEIYFAAVIFAGMTVLLFVQVVSRYVFHYSFTWTEEISDILFVWMIYLGVAAAVTYRKHLKIDAFVVTVPFKARRILLIIDEIIFFAFSLYIIFPMMTLVNNFAARSACSSILRIPKALSYVMIPLCFLLTAVRLIQDIIRLTKEKEEQLGASKPTIDMDELEAEAAEHRKQKELLNETKKGGQA
jgi:TRAP-type C4-dicarboxylate transport system permease small subunit